MSLAIVESLPVDPLLLVGITCTVSPNFLCLGPSSANWYSLSLEISFSISLDGQYEILSEFSIAEYMALQLYLRIIIPVGRVKKVTH